MNGTPSIDVLIVSFNTCDELRQTLQTLLQHPPAPPIVMQVTVLDNASTDGSADAVEREFPQVRLIRGDANLGFGAAMNRMAKSSTANYVLLLNSDMVVSSDFISPLVRVLSENPKAIATAPQLLSTNGQLQYSANRFPSLRYECARLLKGTRLERVLRPAFDADSVIRDFHHVAATESTTEPWEVESIWATCWLLRRADATATGLFDESFPLYDEDLDFCVRAKATDRTFLYVPEAKVTHLGGASSTAAFKSVAMRRARRQYYATHAGTMAAIGFDLAVRTIPKLAKLADVAPRPRMSRRA